MKYGKQFQKYCENFYVQQRPPELQPGRMSNFPAQYA